MRDVCMMYVYMECDARDVCMMYVYMELMD